MHVPLTGDPVFREADSEPLCGRAPKNPGGSPALLRSPSSKAWPGVIVAGDVAIALDGWVVLDGRLLLGRADAERQIVAREIERDLVSFLRRLDNGCFNLVVHDRPRRTTHIANDRFGALPLYLLEQPDALVFASTHAGLRGQAAIPLENDPVGLAELYWFGYQLGARTSLRGVERLPRGSLLSLSWDDGRRTLTSYERVPPDGFPATLKSQRDACDHVFETMSAVVRSLQRDDVEFGLKLSAGMDSRLISAAWPSGTLRTYTFGHPDSNEISLAGRLAASIGARHTVVPLRGDFFTPLHAPMFSRHGFVEWFHQALLPAMHRDGVEFILDGLVGDVLIGGSTLRRLQSPWRKALGIAPDVRALPRGTEAVARYLVAKIKVPDDGFRPLTPDAAEAVNAHWDEIAQDMVGEVRGVERDVQTFEQLCIEVLFNNRSRRFISSQGTVCRPEVETVYPFLDRRFLALLGRFPPEWVANKHLYVTLFSRHYPHVRRAPSTFSLLPFSIPEALHYPGRMLRYGLEVVGTAATIRTGARFNPWVSDGIQWRRWLGFDPQLQAAVRSHLRRSRAFDGGAYDRALASLKRRDAFSGARFMNTASYCLYFPAQA